MIRMNRIISVEVNRDATYIIVLNRYKIEDMLYVKTFSFDEIANLIVKIIKSEDDIVCFNGTGVGAGLRDALSIHYPNANPTVYSNHDIIGISNEFISAKDNLFEYALNSIPSFAQGLELIKLNKELDNIEITVGKSGLLHLNKKDKNVDKIRASCFLMAMYALNK